MECPKCRRLAPESPLEVRDPSDPDDSWDSACLNGVIRGGHGDYVRWGRINLINELRIIAKAKEGGRPRDAVLIAQKRYLRIDRDEWMERERERLKTLRVRKADDCCRKGMGFLEAGDLDQAQKMFLKGVEWAEKAEYPEGQACNLSNLGLVHERRSDLDLAEDYVLKAEALDMSAGDKAGLKDDRFILKRIRRARGRAKGLFSFLISFFRS